MRYLRPDHTFGTTKKCDNCGKLIHILVETDWVYKRHHGDGTRRYFCSWHCLREHDREFEKKHPKKRKMIEH